MLQQLHPLILRVGVLLIFSGWFGFAAASDAHLLSMKTNKSMQQALADLKQAIAGSNYVIIGERDLDEGLVPSEQVRGTTVILFFCNFSMLNQALTIDKRVGLFLPCRVTLVQRKDGVELIAVNPKQISKRLGNPQLDALCDRLTRDYQAILEEAGL